MSKTPEYIKKSVDKYRAGKDFINLTLPKGTKERFESLNLQQCNITRFARELLLEELERAENAERVYFTIGLSKPLVDRLEALDCPVEYLAQDAFENYADMLECIEEDEGEQVQEPPERPEETREEDKTKTVKESPKDDGKPAKKRDNAVVLAELQATVDRKRQKQEERKQKLEQEKEKRKEEERKQNQLEMRRYAENIRDRAKGNQEQKEIVKQFMDDPFLRENVLKPERREDVVEVVGQETYDAIVKADKERRRDETKQRERMRELDVEADQGEVPDFMNDL